MASGLDLITRRLVVVFPSSFLFRFAINGVISFSYGRKACPFFWFLSIKME